jgi:rubrerythrin
MTPEEEALIAMVKGEEVLWKDSHNSRIVYREIVGRQSWLRRCCHQRMERVIWEYMERKGIGKPEGSKYRNQHRVLRGWRCNKCGYFEENRPDHG